MSGGAGGREAGAPRRAGPGRGLLVLSGPSGAGKSSLCARLLAGGGFNHAVSATTRPPRAGEQDGREYYFLGREEFLRRVAAGEFVEHAEFSGQLYGTLHEELRRGLAFAAGGGTLLVDVEVQGAARLRELYPGALFVFLEPPSLAELERRLRDRGSDAPAEIARRLAIARRELERRGMFDVVVVNDDLDRAEREVRQALARAGAPAGAAAAREKGCRR